MRRHEDAGFLAGAWSLMARLLMAGPLIAGALIAGPLMAESARAADEGFPFERELTLQAPRMAESKRLPTLDIGRNGEVVVGLWCKSVRGQFSVAGQTVIFIPGAGDNPACSPAQAARDAQLLDDLSQVTNWAMRGETLVLTGPQTLTYRINTN